MTINGLTISERLINQFRANCQAHLQAGIPFPAIKARAMFFTELRREYDLNSMIIPNLSSLMTQLAHWETETRERMRELQAA
ncbi:MAG: hypothetical protein ABIG63_16185 [Chloroflexota bacterium]